VGGRVIGPVEAGTLALRIHHAQTNHGEEYILAIFRS
jgi:hypothetical protein